MNEYGPFTPSNVAADSAGSVSPRSQDRAMIVHSYLGSQKKSAPQQTERLLKRARCGGLGGGEWSGHHSIGLAAGSASEEAPSQARLATMASAGP